MTEIFNTPQSTKHLRIVAHRGTTCFAPENTPASFIYAGKQHVWAIETDLRMTADNQIVCIHNKTVDSTYNGSGTVSQLTLKELKSMTAIHDGLNGIEERYLKIATLDEYLAICIQYGAIPFIEIKDGVVSETVNKLKKLGLERRSVISSTNPEHLYETRKYSDDIFIHHIFSSMDEAKHLSDAGNAGLSFNYPDPCLLPEGTVERIHGMGLKLCLRAGDTAETVYDMLNLGLDYIPSNQIYHL